MGVCVLVGTYDGSSDAAAMVDSSTGWTVGPIFEAPDAPDHVEAFLAWMRDGGALALRAELNLGTPLIGDGTDPREWEDRDLEKIVSRWRADHVGDRGWLLDPLACACGHHHIGEDGDNYDPRSGSVDGGCFATDRGVGCNCGGWRPGNRAAELLLAESAR